MTDRLIVDLDGAGRVRVSTVEDGEPPQSDDPAEFAWPLDAGCAGGSALVSGGLPAGAVRGVGGPRPAVAARAGRVGGAGFRVGVRVGPGAGCLPAGAGPAAWRWCSGPPTPALLGLPWELMRDRHGPVALGRAGSPGACRWPSGQSRGGAGRAAAGADGDLPPGRHRGCGVSDGGPAAAGAAGGGPRRGRPDRAAPADLRRPAPRRCQQAAEAGEPFHVVHFDGHGVAARPRTAGRRRATRPG